MTSPRRHPDYAPVAVPVPATYAPSLGTHFNYRVDLASLEAVCAFGFQWARIDGQTSDPDTLGGDGRRRRQSRAASAADCL